MAVAYASGSEKTPLGIPIGFCWFASFLSLPKWQIDWNFGRHEMSFFSFGQDFLFSSCIYISIVYNATPSQSWWRYAICFLWVRADLRKNNRPMPTLMHPNQLLLPIKWELVGSRLGEEVNGMKTIEGKTFSVLITDDDEGCREALREIIEPEGFRTRLASSGEEALDIVREEPIHLALLDMNLPRLTGLETLQLVHQINAVMPCILVTGNASEDLMRQAFRVHAYSVIPKPVSRNVLLYTMVRALMRVYGHMLKKMHEEPEQP